MKLPGQPCTPADKTFLLECGGPEPSPGTELLHQVAARTRRILSVFFSFYGTLTPDSREEREGEREYSWGGRKLLDNMRINNSTPHSCPLMKTLIFLSSHFSASILQLQYVLIGHLESLLDNKRKSKIQMHV